MDRISFSFQADSPNPANPAGTARWLYPSPDGRVLVTETVRFPSFEDAHRVDQMLRAVFDLGVQEGEDRLSERVKMALVR